MIALRLFCLWLLAAPATTASTAPAGPITVDDSTPVVNRVMFNRDHPQQDVPALKPGEAALTRGEFECRAGVGYQVISQKRVGDHWHVVARINHADISTRLTDTIYLPLGAPLLLRAHEEGHREMNERVYKEGDAVARSAAAQALAHDWEADGPDVDAAGKAATDLAEQQMCKTYMEATAARASRLGDIYDRFTSHGRNNLYVANAIRLSFLEEQRMPTTRPDELLHATTTESK
jgi:hypothetical protein